MKFILTTLAAAMALLLSAEVFAGVEIVGAWPAVLTALTLGILNALVRPILLFLTLPINILTLGLFTLVINALMVWLAASIITGVTIAGFWWAFAAALIVSIVTYLVDLIDD